MADPAPPCRRFQFRLRTLFGITTAVAVTVWIVRVVWPASICQRFELKTTTRREMQLRQRSTIRRRWRI